MKVLHGANADSPYPKTYTCTVCGNIDRWTDDHHHIIRWAETENDINDYIFIACRKECATNKDAIIKWMAKIPCWNKKLAIENYNKFIVKTKTP